MGSRLFNNTTLAVGVDEAISNSLRKTFHLTEKNCFTIRNGVDIHSFETSMADRNQVRRELGINRDDFVLGMVANFRAVKNHLFLLEAFYSLAIKDERWKLVLVGQGFERDTDNTEPELRKYVADKGLEKNVLFLGFRPDVGKLLGGMDIFCMTSIKEGLPISILEAMASGLPIIGTDVEGINSVVEPNRNGFLAGLNKVEELRKYIELLFVDKELRRRFGEESKRIASRKYSFDKCIAGYQELFLAGENNGHAASS
jgi:glycosyltransferase involved in cell wall biosynthesis